MGGWYFLALILCVGSCGGQHGDESLGFGEMNESFAKAFIKDLINSGLLGNKEDKDLSEVTDVLLSAIRMLSEVRNEDPIQQRTMMVTFASTLAMTIAQEVEKHFDLVQQMRAVTHALRQAYLEQNEDPNEDMVREIQLLVGIYLDNANDSKGKKRKTILPFAKSKSVITTTSSKMPAAAKDANASSSKMPTAAKNANVISSKMPVAAKEANTSSSKNKKEKNILQDVKPNSGITTSPNSSILDTNASSLQPKVNIYPSSPLFPGLDHTPPSVGLSTSAKHVNLSTIGPSEPSQDDSLMIGEESPIGANGRSPYQDLGLEEVEKVFSIILKDDNKYAPKIIKSLQAAKSTAPRTLNLKVLIKDLSSVFRSMKTAHELSHAEAFIQLLMETLISAFEVLRVADGSCIQQPSTIASASKYINALNDILF